MDDQKKVILLALVEWNIFTNVRKMFHTSRKRHMGLKAGMPLRRFPQWMTFFWSFSLFKQEIGDSAAIKEDCGAH